MFSSNAKADITNEYVGDLMLRTSVA
jgi:hypothetical protein